MKTRRRRWRRMSQWDRRRARRPLTPQFHHRDETSRPAERAACDVAPELTSLELDHLCRLVRRIDRGRQLRRHRGYRQDAAAVGHQITVALRGAGMKDFHANLFHRPFYLDV